MNRYYWNEGENELRCVYGDDLAATENHHGYTKAFTTDEWRVWIKGAVEVPGLLWHMRVRDRIQNDLICLQNLLKEAEWRLQNYLTRYATELERTISHKLETATKPG